MVTGDHTKAGVELQVLQQQQHPSEVLTPPALEHREEDVNALWRDVRLLILRVWHVGKPRIPVTDDEGKIFDVGLGLEKRQLAELVAFHGAEPTDIAIRAAPLVWRDGWPRTLLWFTSPRYGGANFHEALAAGRHLRAQARTATSKPTSIAELTAAYLATHRESA